MSMLAHTWRIFHEALKADKARERGHLRSRETDFLPAALDVIERPVSPTARISTWVLLIGLIGAFAWLFLGHVDVVASAPGKIVPTGSVKLVQSAGSGVVRTIYVHDGDVVHAGQPLLDLDPTLSGADLAQAHKALAAAELDMARNRAIADALAGRGLHFVPPVGTPTDVADTQRRLVAAQLAEVDASVSSLSAARSSSLSDAAVAAAQINKLTETLPILDRELDNMNRLDAKGYAPGLRLLELQRQRRQEAGDREVAVAQQARGYSEARKLGDQLAQAREQARRTALTDLAKAQAEAILRREEVTRTAQKQKFQRLLAPVDGTVQQLAMHTIGGVVEPARTLMIIVPAAGGLEVEARILNKDIGFIHSGQTVAVKLEAFPFTRFGAVPGRVVRVSRDAVLDQRLGSIYMATIVLDRATILVDDRAVPLSAGLSATVDIRTGSRRIISYLISPLQTRVSQAGRER
jgi:hemolysin D